MSLFLHIAEVLQLRTDREVARLAGVSPENVANWRSGSVREFKPQRLEAVKRSLGSRVTSLLEQCGVVGPEHGDGLNSLEVEAGSGPSDLQRQFRDRIDYDYLGHRFLYYEPMGALAWENLIRRGYDQDYWLRGVDDCIVEWLASAHRAPGPIASALAVGRRAPARGLDVVSLGPGEGSKELRLLEYLVASEEKTAIELEWLAFAPVDVSIPLLLTAAKESRSLFREAPRNGQLATYQVLPVCADFEDGPLGFAARLPSATRSDVPGIRLILMLGNVLGNVRDEDRFCREQLAKLARPGDLVWVEVGTRMDPIEDDPLYGMTEEDREETSAEASRRLLLEGPYRRWEAATGRRPTPIEVRVRVREHDESCRVPGSLNFSHDLVLTEERRVCSMLYSRRYDTKRLSGFFDSRGFETLATRTASDSKGRARVAHLLLRRR